MAELDQYEIEMKVNAIFDEIAPTIKAAIAKHIFNSELKDMSPLDKWKSDKEKQRIATSQAALTRAVDMLKDKGKQKNAQKREKTSAALDSRRLIDYRLAAMERSKEFSSGYPPYLEIVDHTSGEKKYYTKFPNKTRSLIKHTYNSKEFWDEYFNRTTDTWDAIVKP